MSNAGSGHSPSIEAAMRRPYSIQVGYCYKRLVLRYHHSKNSMIRHSPPTYTHCLATEPSSAIPVRRAISIPNRSAQPAVTSVFRQGIICWRNRSKMPKPGINPHHILLSMASNVSDGIGLLLTSSGLMTSTMPPMINPAPISRKNIIASIHLCQIYAEPGCQRKNLNWQMCAVAMCCVSCLYMCL